MAATMDLSPQFHDPDQEEPAIRRCELEGCDTELRQLPGRENENRYCCPQHRWQARRTRRSTRHG